MIELCKLTQNDRYQFEIQWSDDLVQRFRLSDLQERCPCARCEQGKRDVNPAVMAMKLTKVGNYALKIQFTEGCSKGIYPFELLREIGS
ncbi:DUF971 domain-containing protein [Simkania negevensis]|uniref:Gamma-butyrobetaine hydroxylase-like N-terminal domain-containing protein n=1 Tax=Simkania negevensis (strain ATCC VR-1471 / DSM 27360 / Z) TaxID=331113 RepID=F8L6P0_SIMNZ|nr:DUF971 domain-containing protein [Simkania negevensis]CCB88388.1 putative uncharacterized protein [Simkania negevensis Z]